MASCQKCKSDRVLAVNGKCSDMCSWSLKGQEDNGYVPEDMGIGGDDYIEFNVCLDCGQLQGTWPLPKTEFETDAEVSEDDPYKKGDLVEYEWRGRLIIGEVEKVHRNEECVTVLELGSWDETSNEFVEHRWPAKGQYCDVYIDDPTLKKTDKEW